MVHLNNGILLSREKKKRSFVTAWMELESIMLSETDIINSFGRVFIELNL